MAEALAGLSLAANVMQVVGFAGEVYKRLSYCLDKVDDAPVLWRDIQTTLPTLIQTVQEAERNETSTLDGKTVSQERSEALRLLLGGCNGQVQELKAIVDNDLPKEDDSRRTRTKKALKSLVKDKGLERIKNRLDHYVQTVSNYQTTSMSNLLIEVAKQLDPSLQKLDGIMTIVTQLKQQIDKQPDQVSLKEFKELRAQLDQQTRRSEELKWLLDGAQKKVADSIEPAFDNIPEDLAVSDFVPRDTLTSNIEALLCKTSRKRSVVLKGMGGQGKTQLAISVCCSLKDRSVFHSVFWFDASSKESMERSYEEIVQEARPSMKFSNHKERKTFLDTMLKSLDQPWLLVFDNHDDPYAFDITKFMPQGKLGKFLVTSRHSASTRLCDNGFSVDVDGMEEQEAVALFFKKSLLDSEDEKAVAEVKKIVSRLGYHALAIDLSGSYIAEDGDEAPLDDFLDDFQQRTKDIIARDLPAFREYKRRLDKNSEAEAETALNVFTSWDLSFNMLGTDTPDGERKAHLLTLCAFLHLRVLSERIFEVQVSEPKKAEFPKWLQPYIRRNGEWDHGSFKRDLTKLKEMSLLSNYTIKDRVVTTITLHPLVKDWIKLRLKEKEQYEYAAEAAIFVERLLRKHQNEVATFEMTQDEKTEALSYTEACQANLRLFQTLNNGGFADSSEEEEDDGEDHTVVIGEGELVESGQVFALFFEYMGKIDDARKLFLKVIASRENVSVDKDTDPQLLTSQSLYTEILRLQKDFKSARELDREVYQKRMKLLGEVRFDEATYRKADEQRQALMRDALWSAHDLGWDLEALGDVEEAEKLQRIAYDGRTEIYGTNHALTLQSINNLAHTLRRQGKTLEALNLMQQTLQIGEQVFEGKPHHSELLQFLSNLQDVLRFQGRLEDARMMAQRSLDATCAEWGKDHLKAAASRGQLKDILWDLDLPDKAEEVARENLEIMGKSPYSTDISRIDDIALLLDTLSGRQMTKEDSSRKGTIVQYADDALKLVRKLEEEQKAREKELDDKKDQKEKEHHDDYPGPLALPSTLQDLIYLATGLEVLRASEQLVELEPIIYKYCKKVFGVSDRSTINSLVRYSSALRAQDKKSKADEACRIAIDELRGELRHGEADSTKSTHLAAMSWLAVLYKHVGKRREAVDVYDKAFEYVTRDNGTFIRNADYETLYSIQGLAEDIDDQRRCAKAETLHKAVLETREIKYKKDHPCVDDSLYAYSWNLRLQDRLHEAEEVCLRALSIAQKFRGPHRNTMCILKRLAYLEEQLGKHEAAEKHYREVLDGFRRLGTRHMTRVTEALEDLQELLMEQRKWREARDLIQDAINRRSNGWDRNMGHHAGLIRHLAIVTWELGDGVEGLRLYRKARKTYEQAWGLKTMPDGLQKQNLIRRINELLPGTENMEEELRIEKKESEAAAAQNIANDATAKENADLSAADGGQKTPTQADTPKQTIKHDLKVGLEQVNRSLASHGATQVTYDGKTNQYQTSTKSNEEATASYDAPDVSLSRSSTLGVNSFPEAPGNEPSKLDNEDPAALADITRQMEQATLNTA